MGEEVPVGGEGLLLARGREKDHLLPETAAQPGQEIFDCPVRRLPVAGDHPEDSAVAVACGVFEVPLEETGDVDGGGDHRCGSIGHGRRHDFRKRPRRSDGRMPGLFTKSGGFHE